MISKTNRLFSSELNETGQRALLEDQTTSEQISALFLVWTRDRTGDGDREAGVPPASPFLARGSARVP